MAYNKYIGWIVDIIILDAWTGVGLLEHFQASRLCWLFIFQNFIWKGIIDMSDDGKKIIIKFDEKSEQVVGSTRKIVGLVRAKYLIPIIDNLNLEANPRSSREGSVTDAIKETINNSPELYPFMSKGILLAASNYQWLERNRMKIITDDTDIEGILDGGHNTLAIGLYILGRALDFNNETMPKKAKTWDDFKKLWIEKREIISLYVDFIHKDKDNKEIMFYVPIELLVPSNVDDDDCVISFKNNLLDICAARNNNVQLQLAAKANQRGYFDYLRDLMKKEAPQVYSRIEWKSNDGGDIKVQDLVTLAWIPLNLIDKVRADETGNKQIEPIAPNKLYSSKGACLKQFEKLMSSPDVTIDGDENYKKVLCHSQIESSLRIAVQLPKLYDYIYEKFPELYNKNGGKYGGIKVIKSLNKVNKDKLTKAMRTPFFNKDMAKYKNDDTIETPGVASPDGFIMPLVYGLQALMKKQGENGAGEIVWSIDPFPFLEENLEKIVGKYSVILSLCDNDPQKVGKASQSYALALDAFKMAVAGIK